MSLLLRWATVGAALAGCAVAASQLLHARDSQAEDAAWRSLTSGAASDQLFQAAMVEGLPEPARRYFRYSIAEGTPISTVAEIEMSGRISLGSKEKPNFMPMRARQVLAGPLGFVWRLQAGSGLLRIDGSDGYADGEAWTRFWLHRLIPVVRAGGDEDFARSAAGRAIAESVFWTPGALLPSDTVTWSALGPDSARLVVRERGHSHQVDITMNDKGRPLSVSILRWSRENPQRQWCLQPFGGVSRGEIRAQGYTIAAGIEGGNGYGTPDYFPFYQARVERIRFR